MTPEELLAEYTPLAHKIARWYVRRVPSHVLVEDLIGAAMRGLWDAASRGADSDQFQAYASLRIRGAIIDELRSEDWLSRHARYRPWGAGFVQVGFDDMGTDQQQSAFALEPTAERDAIAKQDAARLRKAVRRLPTGPRRVMQRLLRGVQQRDIALELGLTQARVSQIRQEGVRMLRSTMTGG